MYYKIIMIQFHAVLPQITVTTNNHCITLYRSEIILRIQ